LLAYAAIAAAILALAVITGGVLAPPRPSTSAPEPLATAAPTAQLTATAAPRPSPSVGSGVLSDRFGFIALDQRNTMYVRSERSDVSLASFDASRAWVSPDGRQIAYVSLGQVREIRVRPAAGTSERVIVRLGLGPEDSVSGLAWSNDASGLLLATGSAADTGPGTPAKLETVDIASGLRALIAQRNDGRVYDPLAWDRAGKVVGVRETGAGGYATAYIAIDLSQAPPRVTSFPFVVPSRIGLLFASSDARFVAFQDPDSLAIRWFPIADYAKNASVSGAQGTPRWKPGTSQLAWVVPAGSAGPLPPDADKLFLYDVVTGQRSIAAQSSSIPGAHILAFRPDASAVILAAQSALDATVLELATGSTTAVRSSQGFIYAWVRLG
jgi:hypothetical protein